mmetsp:Transcript_5706/g.7984  ORF Transcript_5706/g.7984 Transcript_5706/m.7984 type:complete len:773 (-) Transcript_5706:55-2373(-)
MSTPDSPSVSLVRNDSEEMDSEDVNVEMAELGSDLRKGHHEDEEEEEWQDWQGFQEYEFSDHPVDVKDVKSLLEAEVTYGEWKTTSNTSRRRRPAAQPAPEGENNNQPQQPTDPKYQLPSFQSPLVTFTLEVMDKVASVNNYSTIFLVALGLIAGTLSATIDITIFQLRTAHRLVLELTTNVIGQYLLWVLYTIAVLWAGITLTIWLAPQAAGSGVPEMRMVVSGVFLKNVLSFKALIVKILGICMSLGSGAVYGKEGPFIHLTCILANQMMRLPFFKTIRQSEHLMLIILGASCATGVAAHFGAPVGGVLFSIEVTSTYYPTRNYWYAYLGTVTGAAAWRYVWNGYFRFFPTFLPNIMTSYAFDTKFTMVEILICSLLGAFLGVISLGFVRLNAAGIKLWRRIVRDYRYFRSPYLYGLFIAVLTATVTFPPLFGSFMDLSPAKALGDLVSVKELSDPTNNAAGSWATTRNFYINLIIFVISRYILIPLSIIVPIPGGLFVPALSLGAGFGRIVGEIVRSLVNNGWTWIIWENPALITVLPGAFAVVGAASFTTAVTHTLSPAVIIFEITGSNVHIIPVLVGVITAFATARKFSSLGIYDSISRLKGLPTLPDLQSDTYTLTAKDMMETNVKYIKKDIHFDELGKILVSSDQQLFPVVHSEETKLLVGTIERENLEMAYNDYQAKQVHRTSEDEHGGEGLLQRHGTASLVIKPTPIRFVESTPLIQIHLLFTTMRLSNAFVTRNGALRGMITRQGLKAAIERVDKKNTILND